MKKLFLPLVLLSLGACSNVADRNNAVSAETEETTDTLIYVSEAVVSEDSFLVLKLNPEKAFVTMADSVIPEIGDSTVALCVEAAFTGDLLENFSPSNIAGNYVIDGIFHKGYDCDANTGFLCTVEGKPFISDLSGCAEWEKKAVEYGQTLFQQMLVIQKGENVYKGIPIKPDVENIYRAACVMSDGDFAVIQSKESLSMGSFIAGLQALDVSDALYLDMGTGWNYGWYRETESSEPVKFFEERTPYQTNWLIIKKK